MLAVGGAHCTGRIIQNDILQFQDVAHLGARGEVHKGGVRDEDIGCPYDACKCTVSGHFPNLLGIQVGGREVA